MENIFKFKRATKSIGDFDANDPNEWTLLVKPQIGGATLFVHFHKLWLVKAQPAIEADEDNGIEGQEAIVPIPACEVYFGFVKDDNFVIEKQKNFKGRVDVEVEKLFVSNLTHYVEQGYTKDWARYNADNTVNAPGYYEYPKNYGSDFANRTMKTLQSMVNAMPPSTPVTNNAASIMSANKLFQRRKSNP